MLAKSVGLPLFSKKVWDKTFEGVILCEDMPLGVLIFFIAASPGYLDIYYKEVFFISESFLLGLHLFMAETEKQKAQLAQQAHEDAPAAELPETDTPAVIKSPEQKEVDRARIDLFVAGIAELTAKERMIYDCHISGMPTSDIMEKLNIKENTLKFHNKNIYSKLGVSSRKQLQEIYRKVSEIAQNN